MSDTNTIWVLLCTVLIFFMQAGFTMTETGFTRAKNAGSIIIKNMINLALGTCIFWLVGFGLMYGAGNGFLGWIDFAFSRDYTSLIPENIPQTVFFLFQCMLCLTASTIVSGAMAERMKTSGYCIFCLVISALIYPLAGHWIRAGWLADMGFLDFAGASAVHLVGGTAALVGAWMLGPRLGKYDDRKTPRAIPGHSIPLSALGVFILWFCWFGFTGGSAFLAPEGLFSAGHIFLNTQLSAAFAVCSAFFYTWARYGKPDITMTLNGALAGLVAISAGCAALEPAGAAITGAIAGICCVLSIEFVDKKLKIDDPVGAFSVHATSSILGLLLTGIFSTEGGLLYGGGAALLGIQLLGVLCIAAWTGITIFLLFRIIQGTIGIRVDRKAEIVGLDNSEHGLVSAYPDFIPSGIGEAFLDTGNGDLPKESIALKDAVPLTVSPSYQPGQGKLTKVEVIMKQERFEALKHAVNELGVTGMTVTHVLGCGIQKGASEYYRGVEMEMQLLPKICVEIVIAKVPLEDLVNTIRNVLYTGHIGDGKIFIYNVDNVIKVRTGEQGYDAMQGNDE